MINIANLDKNKILKLSIDPEKVEDDLINFPILLNLSTSSGINAFDCTQIFEELNDIPENSLTNEYVQLYLNFDNPIITDIAEKNANPVLNGGATQVTFCKFGTHSIHLASGHISVINGTSFNISTKDFTIEGWYYRENGGTQYINFFEIGTYSTGINLTWDNNGSNFIIWCAGIALFKVHTWTLNEWTHVALVRKSGNVFLFINGILIDNRPAAGAVITGTTTRIGFDSGYTGYYYGYIDNFLVAIGLARWIANFTVPDNPYTIINPLYKNIAVVYPSLHEHWFYEFDDYTKFLLYSNNIHNSITFEDTSKHKHTILVGGNVVHSNAQIVFGDSSVYFDGVGDCLQIVPIADNFKLNYGDFEISAWIYPYTGVGSRVIISQFTTYPGTLSFYFALTTTSATEAILNFRGGNSAVINISGNTTIYNNTWTHVAAVRYNNLTKLYVDGIAQTTTHSGIVNLSDTNNVMVGANNTGGAEGFVGFIQNLRISKGSARWTSNFTPPNMPYEKENKLVSYIHEKQEQCYCEITNWNYENKSAQIWIKVPKILTNQPTNLLLYYDTSQGVNTTYVGMSGEPAAQKVWDSNYVAVYHLTQDPSVGGACILDSTSNVRHGTPSGSMTSADLVQGLKSKGLEFDGSDDSIRAVEGLALPIITIEASHCRNNNSNLDDMVVASINYYNTDVFQVYTNNTSINNTWYNSVTTYSHIASSFKYYSNGSLMYDIGYAGVSTSTEPWLIGAKAVGTNGTSPNTFFSGIISEVRFSNIVRSAVWIKVSNHTLRDNLLSINVGGLWRCAGYITEKGIPVQRDIYLYERTSGELMAKGMSNNLGYYSLLTTTSGLHNIVCLDSTALPNYDDLIMCKIIPTEVV